jgi:hypothetical protein
MSSQYRPEAVVHQVVSVVPAANATYTVSLAPGNWHLSMAVFSSVTGTTTDVTVRAYTDAAQTQVAAADFQLTEPDDTALTTNISLAASTYGQIVHIHPNAAGVPIVNSVVLPYGLQVGVTKGGATTGEKLEVTLCAVRA